jgi:hypothetical protein
VGGRQAIVAAAVGVAVMAAGCGGGSGTTSGAATPTVASGGGATGAPASSAASASPAATATPLTTAALLAALLPRTAVPAGYQRRHRQAFPQRSGTLGCGRSGVVPARMVGEDFQAGMTGAEIDEILRGYPSTAVAHTAMRQIVAFARACHHSGSYTLHAVSFPRVGEQAQAISVVNTLAGIGVVGRARWVFVLDSTTIAEVNVTGSGAAAGANPLPLVRAAVAGLR